MSYKNMIGIYLIVVVLSINYFGCLGLMFNSIKVKGIPLKFELLVIFIQNNAILAVYIEYVMRVQKYNKGKDAVVIEDDLE